MDKKDEQDFLKHIIKRITNIEKDYPHEEMTWMECMVQLYAEQYKVRGRTYQNFKDEINVVIAKSEKFWKENNQ